MHHDEEEEEGAILVLEQRRKFKRTVKKMQGKYAHLEEDMIDSRRPPCLRTAGGEIVQGTFPATSVRWLGVPPRFGTEVPEEKYVGGAANELSKWISTDKTMRLKQLGSVYDQNVRSYLKLDDAVDVQKMTGSHLRFMRNPLEEEEEEQPRAIMDKREPPPAIMNKSASLEDDESGSEMFDAEDYDYDHEPAEKEERNEVEAADEAKESEEEEEDESSLVSGTTTTASVDQAEELAILDEKFKKYCDRLSSKLQSRMLSRSAKVEHDWRAGQAMRPPTLRFRR